MGCCGGGHNSNNRVKNWGTETKENESTNNISPMIIILGILSIGLIAYQYFV